LQKAKEKLEWFQNHLDDAIVVNKLNEYFTECEKIFQKEIDKL
jgi:hypothetical protein